MDPITTQASTFTPWTPLGPSVLTFLAGGIVTALVRGPGRLAILARSTSGMIMSSSFDEGAEDTGWDGWSSILDDGPPAEDITPPMTPQAIASAVAGITAPNVGVVAVPRSPDTLELVNLDADGSVWACRYSLAHPEWPEQWQPISSGVRVAPGTIPSGVTVGRDVELLFVIGSDGAVWIGRWDSSVGWGSWAPIGDAGIIDPCRRQRVAAVGTNDGCVEIFAIDRRGRVITTSLDGEGLSWKPWTAVGTEAMFAPQSQVTALSVDPEHLVVFAPANDRGVYTAARTGGVWGPWTRIGDAGLLAAHPRIAVTAVLHGTGTIELFVTGHDGVVYESAGAANLDFRDWAPLQGLSEPIPPQSIVTAISCREGRTDLFIVQSDGVIQVASRGAARRPGVAAVEPAPRRAPPSPRPGESPAVARFKQLQAARGIADLRIQRFAFLVGINAYAEPEFGTLKGCVNDVLSLADALEGAHYAKDSIVTLHDDAPQLWFRPTRENIMVELRRLCKKVGPSDFLLVHFSCHGTLSEKDRKFYLVTANARAEMLEESALAAEEVMEILKTSEAGQIVVLLDACHSGASGGRNISEPGVAEEFIHNVFERARGTKVLAASMKNQIAKEREDTGRGVFTSFVIEALTRTDDFARADRGRKGFVSFSDLGGYVCNAAAKWNEEHPLNKQFPNERGECIGDLMVADFRDRPTGA